MRTETEDQRQRRLKAQRDWSKRNQETIRAYRKEYYLKNRTTIREQQRLYKRREKEILNDNPEPSNIKIKRELINSVLRANPKHYLNNKEVFKWGQNDLNEFNRLTTQNHL